MRGPTETSTAFNSSKFEELMNLSLIEPLNSFKKSNFFSVLGAILNSWFEIDLLSDVGFVVFSACSSFLLFSCSILLLYSSISSIPTDDSQNLLAINESNETHRGTNKPRQSYQYFVIQIYNWWKRQNPWHAHRPLGFFPNFNKYRGKGLRIKIPK